MKIAVVLANWMDGAGNLNAETTARVDAGIAQLNADATHLLLMGWACVPGSDLTIATAMRRYCMARGVAADRVLTDDRSRDTVGDAIFARLTLDKLAPNQAINVVTSDYHIARTAHIFGRVFGKTRNLRFVPAPAKAPSAKSEAASIAAFDQTFKNIADSDIEGFFERMICDHPFYNGQVHPAVTRPD